MARKGRTTILREGRYYIGVMAIIFLAALIRDINMLMLLFAMMAGSLFFSWRYLRRALDQLHIVRGLPKRISAGDVLEVEFEAANRRRRGDGWSIVLEDRITRLGQSAPSRVMSPAVWWARVPAGESRRAVYRCRLNQRGKYRFGPAHVSTHGVLGLLRKRMQLDEYATLTVGPRLGRLAQGWGDIQHEAHQSSQKSESLQGFLEGDFHGLRKWRSGDSRRWIHWRTTARKGELMVRQFEKPSNQNLVLVVELWQPEHPKGSELENVELAVSFAGTLVAERCRRGGSEVTVSIAASEGMLWNGSASIAFFQDSMDALAMAEATSVDSLPAALERALGQARPGSQVVIVSSRAIDLAETERFSSLWQDARTRNWMGRIRIVDSSCDRLAQYFEVA